MKTNNDIFEEFAARLGLLVGSTAMCNKAPIQDAVAAEEPSDIVSVKLRIKEGFRQQFAADAKKANHSINQEIVRRLERSYVADDRETAIHIAAEEAAKRAVEALDIKAMIQSHEIDAPTFQQRIQQRLADIKARLSKMVAERDALPKGK